MNENLLQLGGVFILAMSLVEIIKMLISFLFKRNGGNNNQELKMLNTTLNNHYLHFKEALEKHCERQEVFEGIIKHELSEIKTFIEIIKQK